MKDCRSCWTTGSRTSLCACAVGARRTQLPPDLIFLLEDEGVAPSVYHLKGLRDAHPPHAELMEIQAQIAKLSKLEWGE